MNPAVARRLNHRHGHQNSRAPPGTSFSNTKPAIRGIFSQNHPGRVASSDRGRGTDGIISLAAMVVLWWMIGEDGLDP